MKFIKGIFFFGGILFTSFSLGKIKAEDLQLYKKMASMVRQSAEFEIPIPGTVASSIGYYFEIDKQKQEMVTNEFQWSGDQGIINLYWDRYFLKDGSYLEINGEKLPLTCLVISGQDNRYSKTTGPAPLIPDHIIDVKLVVNDYTCTGPINPGFPYSGKKEMWDTYLHYRISDPTIMLPTNSGIRYRWNEFETVLKK